MSRELRIWIDGTEAEVVQGGNTISFVYSIEGTEPGKLSGAYAKRSITLPGTKANHAIFENIDQAESVVTDANKLLPARAEVGGIPVLTGKAQLNRAALASFRHGLRASNYQVTFVGANADWFQDIGGLLVRDLGWDDVVLSPENYDSLGDAQPVSEDTCFILMKWKPWERTTSVLYTELTPALFLAAIFRRAFQEVGYNFVSILTNDPFNRLCVPVPLKLDGDYAANFINVRTSVEDYIVSNFLSLSTQIIFDDDSTPPNVDGGSNYNILTGEYTVPIAGVYTVKITGENTLTGYIDNPAGTRTNRLYVYKNGVKIADSYVDLPLFGPFEFEDIFEFAIGDVVTIWYLCEQVIGTGGPVITWDMDATLSIEAEKDRWEMGEILDYSNIIPGTWFVKDFIRDATRILNLAWETDVLSRTVYAYVKDEAKLTYRINGDGAGTTATFGGFFQTGNEIDITRKINLGDGGEMELITDRTQDFVMAWGTGDPTTEELEKRNATSLYSARYRNATGRFPAGATWLYTEIFAKTIHINETAITSGGGMAIQVPLLYGKNYFEEPDAEPDYSLNPRLLYFAGRRAGDDGWGRIYNADTSATSAYDFPAAWQVNYNDTSAVDWSLSFSDEVTNYGGTVRGLFKSLHLQQARRMEEGRRYRVNVLWNELDISALTFRKAMQWRDMRLLLEKIDGYTPTQDRATRTEIILDVLPSVADAAKVSGPVLLEGATQNGLTSLGSINGVIGAPSSAGNTVIRYRQLIENSASRFITLPGSSGILSLPNPYVAVTVNQNGKVLIPELEYTITGAQIEVNEFTHFDGCVYFITIHDVV